MTVFLASIVDVTIVIALSLAAAAALKGRSAALRHAVLAAGVAAAVLSPALELLVPQLPVVRWHDAAPAISSGGAVTPSGAAVGFGAAAGAAPEAPAIPWAALLLAVWMIGAAVTLAGLATALVRLARLTARCTPVREGRWREMADELSNAFGLRRAVAILQSADPSLLVTCGVLRPAIILPAGAAAWTDDRRRVVLAHELAHVCRHDGATQLAAEVLRGLHWFNPLVWLSCRRLRQESEYACDDAVLSGGIDPTEYAAHLLDVARHASDAISWASAPAIAHPSSLERRIAAMLNHQRNRRPLTRRAWAGAALATVAVVFPLVGAGVAPPEDSPLVILAAVTGGTDVALVPPPSPQPARSPAASRPAPAARLSTATDAQQAPAAISATVLDQSGGTLPGVRLTLTDTEAGVQHTTHTDANGRFGFRELRPARYELVASLSGFATVSSAMPLAPADSVVRVITLPLGTLEQTVTVGCAATVATAAPPARERVAMRAPQPAAAVRPAGLRHTWNRALEAIVPVLSAQQTGSMPPVRVGGVIRPPTHVTSVSPLCPAALPRGRETIVRLVGRIGVDGSMNDVTPTVPEPGAAPPAEFTRAALDAVRQWTFTPTLLNGRPVEVNITIHVIYRPIP